MCCGLHRVHKPVKMTICPHSPPPCFIFFRLFFFSSTSCRRHCRSRLPPCPRGPASPLDSWASPKPGSCNCAGVSHSSNSLCVGCVQAPFHVISFLVKHLVAAQIWPRNFCSRYIFFSYSCSCFLLVFLSHFFLSLPRLVPVDPPGGVLVY